MEWTDARDGKCWSAFNYTLTPEQFPVREIGDDMLQTMLDEARREVGGE